MLAVSTRLFIMILATTVAMVWTGSASASLSVAADNVSVPGLDMVGMQADIDPAAGGKGLDVKLSAERTDMPALGWRKLGLALDGALDRDELGRWVFDGSVKL